MTLRLENSYPSTVPALKIRAMPGPGASHMVNVPMLLLSERLFWQKVASMPAVLRLPFVSAIGFP